MEYQSVKEFAEKNNLNIRTVQKWAKEGKLEGAYKVGRDWMIPKELLDSVDQKTEEYTSVVQPMPILFGKFEVGKADAYIDSLASKEERKLARAEYHYFRGECTRALYISEELKNSKTNNIRLSALLIHAFSSVQLQRTYAAKQDLQTIRQDVKDLNKKATEQEKLFGYFVMILSRVLLHDTQELENPFAENLQGLPDGLRFFGTYVMSHYYYLKKEYEHSLGIAETSMALFGKAYPMGNIYLFLSIAMNLINLHEEEKAEYYFKAAWEIAKPDGFIEPFAEHHGLLGGLVEKCLKKSEPESYAAIDKMVYAFSEGWRQIHNPMADDQVTSDLTTMEFSVAMLANKGWSNKEIAKQLQISENKVKNITKSIYQKLKITGRKELEQFMLK